MHFLNTPSVSLIQKRFLIFLAGLSVIGMVLGCIAISRYGSGVASDSVKYLAVAQNLIDGHGLFDHRGSPLLSWPPLYSLVLAGLGIVTGLDIFIVGGYFNVLLLGANIFLSGLILWRGFSTKPLYAYLGSVFVLLCISSLRVHATIFSEPLYLTLTLGFLLAVDEYIRERSRRSLLWMLVFGALAPMLRYVGLAVGATAGLIILIENRKSLRVFWRDGFIVGLASILPIGWWLGVHNVLTYGTLWGTGDAEVDVYQNTSLALTKILHWFVPYLAPLMPALLHPFLLLAALAVFVIVINLKRMDRFHTWAIALANRPVYPSLLYGFVYLSAVVATGLTTDHQWLYSDRYHVIVLVAVVFMAAFTFDILFLPHLKFFARRESTFIVIAFLLWSVYPLYGLREYLALALERGEPTGYNLFNTRDYHEMRVITELQRLRNDQPDVMVYSNYVDAVWFYTRKSSRILPFIGDPNFNSTYAGWPGGNGYLVWFKPNEYKHYAAPAELAQIVNLQLVYTDDSGDIYYITPR